MNDDYGKGYFLIANPVLPDPNFSRTVVLLCNHDEHGSFGLVVNKAAELDPAEIFSRMDLLSSYKGRVYIGGPVSQSQMFYICRSEEPIPELDQICQGVHLGMDWNFLENILNRITNPEENIRFFLGYSGWAAGQLAGEMEQRSWLTCEATEHFVFENNLDRIWPGAVKSLGKEYEYLIHAPVNPQWN
ncbi:MAG: YqgE/AlgH family protein [Nitrospinae bacterium]|jgi:putative transcriptional regulator|nr:YqgE/AlgH family protein [Nitrospinota bacterium]MDA1109553.1 YqgE/AlgH family protein [Nitrospinota bacterium]